MPCPHSNTKVLSTVANEPLGDITRSDVKDVAANSNTKQLFTEVSGNERESGKWHDSQQGFIHFHPIYYLKGDRARGNSIYPTKFIK